MDIPVLCPVAMMSHKSRSYRIILDLSFQLKYKKEKQPSLISATNKLSPSEAMVQLGQCLHRIVSTMADNYDPNKPFLFSKTDIKDELWRMAVSNDDAWNFCYVKPSLTPLTSMDDIEIVVPNSLQMG